MIFLKLAKREVKNNYKYWVFFTLNLLIGLLGFTFILLFRNNITANLELRAKTMLTSDLAITGRRALVATEKEGVDEYLRGKFKRKAQLTELYSMGKVEARDKELSRTRLVHIKVLEGLYPLIGKISLQDGRVLDDALNNELGNKPRIIISKEVAHQFKIKKKDSIYLGRQNFEVLGILAQDSTSSMRGFNLAPKVYIHHNYLKATELVAFGTVAWFTDFYILKENISLTAVQEQLQKHIIDPAISIKTPKESGQQLGRILNYLSDYLGLIGVIALLISTVGASYLFQTYIYDRIRQMGILKTIGVTKNDLIKTYVCIIFFMGFISSCLSLVISYFTVPLGLSLLNNWIKGTFENHISLDVVIAVLCIGIFINVLSCVPILMRVFKAKTIHLLGGGITTKMERREYFYYLPALFFLWGLSVYQAHSFIIGSVFCFSLFVIFCLVLFILPWPLELLNKLLIGKRISTPYSLAVGYSLRVLIRNKISTILTVLSLAMGISLMSVIGQLDTSIKSELVDSKTPKPSLFLFDVQGEQYQDLLKLKKENHIPMMEPSPMVRARLIAINGVATKREKSKDGFSTREEENSRRFNNRGVNLSYASGINSSEKIVKGKAFSGRYSGEGPAEISLEKRYAQRLGVDVGAKLTYDVMGVEVEGIVINLRTVKWTSFLPNFFIVFQPGVLEEAPKTYIAVVEKVDFDQQLLIQEKVVQALPNVSILNVTDIIKKILILFEAMGWALSAMSICTIIVGMFVLYSILQSQIHKKQKDIALQKLMGMSESMVFKTIFFEFLFISLLGMGIGNSVGPIISYIVSVMFLDGVFVFNWTFFISFNLLLLLIVMGIIYLSYKNNYQKKIYSLLE